jgi:hypothetical protein
MAEQILPQDFYVYAHIKASTNEIFYIGKGLGNRAWRKDGRGTYWKRVVAKHGLKIKILIDGLQEWAAFEFERDYISLYGRKDMGYGQLINLTCGGDGVSGLITTEATKNKIRQSLIGRPRNPQSSAKSAQSNTGKKRTIDSKKRMSAAQKGKVVSEATREKLRLANLGKSHTQKTRIKISMIVTGRVLSDSAKIKIGNFHRGRKHSQSTRDKISLAKKGVKISEATKIKMSQSSKNKRSVAVVGIDLIFESISHARDWAAIQIGSDKVCPSSIAKCCRGKLKTAYGYTWKYA